MRLRSSISQYTIAFIVGITVTSSAMADTKWSITAILDNSAPPVGLTDSGVVLNNAQDRFGSSSYPVVTGFNGAGRYDVDTTSLGYDYGFARDINDSGQIVGYVADFATGSIRGFITTGNNGTGIAQLDTLGSDKFSTRDFAFDTNESGQAVGSSVTSTGYAHAFMTGANGAGITDLGTLGGNTSSANGINDAGQVVGQSQTVNGETHAFITGANGIGMTDLGTLGGNFSFAIAINNSGQVIGSAKTADNTSHAFVTGTNGVGLTDLGEGFASDINDSGDIIGTFAVSGDTYRHNFLYHDGTMTDLTPDLQALFPNGTFFSIQEINNVGQIAGMVYYDDFGFSHDTFLLSPIQSPIPEPETYLMLLTGLGLLRLTVRRRKAAQQIVAKHL